MNGISKKQQMVKKRGFPFSIKKLYRRSKNGSNIFRLLTGGTYNETSKL